MRHLIGRTVLVLGAGVLAGCRGDRAANGTPPDSLPAVPPGEVVLRLEVPDTLGWGQEDSVVVEVANQADSARPATRLELLLPRPLAAVDSAGTAPAPGGVALTAQVPGLAVGQRFRMAYAFRMPPAPLAGETPATSYVMNASYAGARPAADTLHVRPGSEAVSGGCATPEAPAAQRYGVGPVRIGMTAASLRAACPEARDSTWAAEGNTERGLVVRPGGVAVLAELSGDTVRRVTVTDPRIRTAAGMAVGAGVGELRARYGAPCAGQGDGVVAMWFQNAPGVSFRLDTVSTRRWSGQVSDLADSVRVISLMIHGEDPRCTQGEAR